MASSIFQRTVVDEQGNIVTGAVVEVRNEATDELAPIFVDRPLAEVKANPFTTDSTGFIKFFVARGEYRIKATFGDNEIIWRFVQMLDTDYLVNLDVAQTLENKTLIEPVIETISNTGLLSLPAATDTLVGRATTDTLTNKTLTSPTINGGTITGITDLAVADGGTGRSALTANNVLIGNGTSAVNFVAPGAVGNVLVSDGTAWTSAASPSAGVVVQATAPIGAAEGDLWFNTTTLGLFIFYDGAFVSTTTFG